MKNLLLTSTIIVSLLAASCKKEEPQPEPVPTTSNLGGLFDQNVTDAKQNFTINASIYNEIIGDNGVKIMVPANSFEDANGNIVSGNVTLELIEVLDQTSMIMMNKPTTSNGGILVSGGQIKLTASQSGSQLFLADNAYLDVMVPTTNADPNMLLFDGTEDSNGDVDWILSTDDTTGYADSTIIVTDSTFLGSSDYYWFSWTDSTMGWINCDYFYYDSNPLTNVYCDLEAQYDYTNTACFIHFSNINSLASLYWSGTNFSSTGIPETTVATIVCISEISGNYFSAFVPITVTTNLTVNPTMSATTLSAFEAEVDNL